MNIIIVQSSDRIAKLKEKIDGIQISIEKEKTNQLEQINSRIETLDERLKNTIDSRAATIGAMSNDV